MMNKKYILFHILLFLCFVYMKSERIPNFKLIYLSETKYYIINQLNIYFFEETNCKVQYQFTEEQKFQTEKESKMISLSKTDFQNINCLLLVKQYIYFFSDSGLISTKSLEEIKGFISEIYFYKCNSQYCYFIVGFINSDKQINLLLYSFSIDGYNIELITNFTINDVGSNNFFCHLMKSENLKEKYFTCFYQNSDFRKIMANIIYINIETKNITSLMDSSKTIMGAKIIKSVLSKDGKNTYICYINNDNNCDCLTYINDNNEWSNYTAYLNNCLSESTSLFFDYFGITNEYFLYCYQSSTKINIMKLNDNLEIIYQSEHDAYDLVKNCSKYFLSSMYYSSKKIYIMKLCLTYNNNNWNYDIRNALIGYFPELYTTIMTTILTTIPSSTLPEYLTISTISSLSNFSTNTEIYKSSWLNSLTTSLSTVITSVFTNNEFLISSTIVKENFPKENLPSSSTNIVTTSLTSIITSIYTNKITNNIDINAKDNLSTYQEIYESSSTNILTTSLTSIITSIFINTTTNNMNFNASNLLYISDSISSLSSLIILTDMDNKSYYEVLSQSNKEVKNDLMIIQLKTNKTKEEMIRNNVNEIIEDYDYNKIYEIFGNDYRIKLCPIGINKYKNISTFINFFSCENKLRNIYNKSEDSILTVFLLEIFKNNNNSLINQVEYAIFDEFNNMMDLSICSKDQIKIYYNIINSSILNTNYISFFQNMGVDIFNIKDDFFNNICFPYFEKDSDLILEDRLKYIYQNYSLCDSNCEYENIDIQNMTIECNCKVKTKIETKIEELNYNKMVSDLFKYSTIGVIKCYKLVFNNNKKDNIGFWIFLILIIIQMPFITKYIIFTDKSIRKHIKEKIIIINNFKIFNPKKKSFKGNKRDSKTLENQSAQNELLSDLRTSKKLNNKYNNSLNKYNKSFIENKSKKNNIITTSNNNSLKAREILISKKIMNKIFDINYHANDNFILNNNIINRSFENNLNNKNFESLDISNKNYYKTVSNFNSRTKKINISFLTDNNVDITNFLFQYNLFYDNYQEAIKYEKRTFWKILFATLILKEKLINLCYFHSQLELKPIKVCLVIFVYSCNFSLNTLFYFSNKISDKYHYKGNNLFIFTLFNNISICLVSTFLSILIITFLTYLTNSKNEILNVIKEGKKIKNNKNNHQIFKDKNIINKFTNILNKLKEKIVLFIFIELILLLFFFYFTTAFCEVYKKTQITWIIDCFTSFLISILSEILVSFIITILYIISLKNKISFLYTVMRLLL